MAYRPEGFLKSFGSFLGRAVNYPAENGSWLNADSIL